MASAERASADAQIPSLRARWSTQSCNLAVAFSSDQRERRDPPDYAVRNKQTGNCRN
jgi:hypothetical protein